MAQRQPNIAPTAAGLAKVAIGNMQTEHGFELLPAAWEGKPDFFSHGTVVNESVVRRLGLFGESGAVLGKLCEFEWCVGQGPLFSHKDLGLEWKSIEMLSAAPTRVVVRGKPAIDLCDDHDDDRPDWRRWH